MTRKITQQAVLKMDTGSPMLRVLCLALLGSLMFYRAMFPGMHLPPTKNTQVLSDPPQHVYSRLVYIVLDGLRFDALVPVDKTGPYHNRISITSDPAVKSEAFLSIAGLPTATTSRVVALMTGMPSGPLDLVWAFTARRVAADNLTARFQGASFFGDECWPEMFPALAARSATMPSYSRTDQAAREDALVDSLITTIATQENATFAHLTTLDTYGHAFGINHDMIASTLDRWNSYLRRIYDAIDEKTLLVVVSDHGVTSEGAHGGCTAEELASVCVFFSKNPLITDGPGRPKTNTAPAPSEASYHSFIRRFYNTEEANTPRDWIKATAPYRIIHQDDIVVTISYLLNLPPPLNAYGNLIPFLVRDEAAEQALAVLKARHPALGKEKTPILKDSRAENYRLTAEIHMAMTARHRGKALCALVLCAAAFFLLLRLAPRGTLAPSLLPSLLATFLATHSIRAFTSEDFLWSAVLFILRPRPATAALLLLYACTPGRPVLSMDRIIFPFAKFQDATGPLSVAVLYTALGSLHTGTTTWKECISHVYRASPIVSLLAPSSKSPSNTLLLNFPPHSSFEVDHAFLQAVWSLRHPLLHVCAALLCGKWDHTARITLLASDPSAWALVAAHLRPGDALLTLLAAGTFDPLDSPGTLYALLAFLPYCSNLEKMVQSLDYEALFVFSETHTAIVFSAISYLALPRALVIARFYRRARPSSPGVIYPLLVLNLFGLFFAFLCAWAQHGHLAFQNFFVSRVLFITGYCIVDTIIWVSLEVATRIHASHPSYPVLKHHILC